MIGYEINLICDAPFCTELICTEPKEDASFETIREFGEANGWQIDRTRIYCPDHLGG